MIKRSPMKILPHGIKIISERAFGEYISCLIEPHPFFPNSAIDSSGRQSVSRARVVMSSILGRALRSNEHVHHKKKKFKRRDTKANLELLTAAEHNKRHKTGTKHRQSSKAAIAKSLKAAYDSGRRKRPDLRGKRNPFFGKTHNNATREKIADARRKMQAC